MGGVGFPGFSASESVGFLMVLSNRKARITHGFWIIPAYGFRLLGKVYLIDGLDLDSEMLPCARIGIPPDFARAKASE